MLWRYFCCRLLANPSYYDLEATDADSLNVFLSALVEDTLADLEVCLGFSSFSFLSKTCLLRIEVPVTAWLSVDCLQSSCMACSSTISRERQQSHVACMPSSGLRSLQLAAGTRVWAQCRWVPCAHRRQGAWRWGRTGRWRPCLRAASPRCTICSTPPWPSSHSAWDPTWTCRCRFVCAASV